MSRDPLCIKLYQAILEIADKDVKLAKTAFTDLLFLGYFTLPSLPEDLVERKIYLDNALKAPGFECPPIGNDQRILAEMPPKINPDITREVKRVKHHIYRASRVAQAATLTLEQWIETLNFYNWQCALCPNGSYEVLEHFVPIICGGGTTAYNCIPACASCNGKKNDMHPLSIPAEKPIARALQNAKIYLDVRKNMEDE